MRRMQVRLLICMLLVGFCVKAQLGKEAWHWQFGYKAALDFSSGTPVLDTSLIHTDQGCASISDKNTGQLLFYTDGDSVWNRNDQLMPHGSGLLGGHGTCTQAALIIPKPGSDRLYYVVTADQGGTYGPNQGVHYSIVDMSLNAGLGDVTSKNILLTPPPTTEKLVGVRNCNGQDYWVITHPFYSNAFNAYLVTPNGISPTPVVSYAGTVVKQDTAGLFYETVGYLKASPNGKKLAQGVYYFNPVFELFDFDNATGVVSHPITVHYPISSTSMYNSPGMYGVSFSPDNSKVYAYSSYFGTIDQFDLSSNNPASVIASETQVANSLGTGGSAIQLGPDGKLYIASQGSFLSVIHNPNALGAACNFQLNAIAFPGNEVYDGLPNFIDGGVGSTTILNMADIVHCGNFAGDSLNAGSIFSSYAWSTGATTQSIYVTQPGTYWVSAVSQNGCKATDTVRVKVIDQSSPHKIDTTFCSSTGYYLADATYGGALNYQWSNGSTNPVNYISTSGMYWVDIDFGTGCVLRDTFKIGLNNDPTVSLSHDTVICDPNAGNGPVILHAISAPGNTYVWSNGSTASTASVYSTGVYTVTVTSPAGCTAAAQINVYDYRKNAEPLFDTLVMCSNQFPITLDATITSLYPQYNYYQWSNGFTGATALINSGGRYFCDIAVIMPGGTQCHVRDTFQVNVFTGPPNGLLPDTMVDCDKLPVLINAAYPLTASYVWSDGFSGPQHYISQPGYYNVRYHFNDKCNSIEYFTLGVNSKKKEILFPNIVTPNGDSINDLIDLGKYELSGLQFDVFDRWGRNVYSTSDPSAKWSPTEPDGTYFYVLRYTDVCGTQTTNASLKGFITLTR